MHDRPILVSGPGRSGSTWMQWLLTAHAFAHIHGQSPNIAWSDFWQWRCRLVEQGAWARKSNEHVGYAIAHYAGSEPDRADDVFRRMFRHYMTGFGPNRTRWGLKWIGLCSEPTSVEQFETLWPDARWIVCLRDPFTTIESAANTFVPDLDPADHAREWTAAACFALAHDADRTALFQIDRLTSATPDERRRALDAVWRAIDLDPDEGVAAFLARWPIVHKAKPEERRTFRLDRSARLALLDAVPELGDAISELGYSLP